MSVLRELRLTVNKLGVRRSAGLAALFVGAALLVWAATHWNSQPGERVSVFWGLVEYTKSADVGDRAGSDAQTPAAKGDETQGRPTGVNGIHQSTNGDSSPAVAGVEGDVTISIERQGEKQ